MDGLIFSIVKNPKEIEVLRGRKSTYRDFTYVYDDGTIDLLQKHFEFTDSLYIVVKQKEQFVAFCSLDRDWWEDNYFFLREIFVDPNFQKQKIGQEFIKRCIEHAQKKGAFGVVTETAFWNVPMRKLCVKLGFQEWDNPQWKEGLTYKFIF